MKIVYVEVSFLITLKVPNCTLRQPREKPQDRSRIFCISFNIRFISIPLGWCHNLGKFGVVSLEGSTVWKPPQLEGEWQQLVRMEGWKGYAGLWKFIYPNSVYCGDLNHFFLFRFICNFSNLHQIVKMVLIKLFGPACYKTELLGIC